MRNEIGNSGKSGLHGRTANLDWESLRTVLAVTRAKSLAGAARALGLQHSTVYRRIEEVERRLGQPLFDRNRGGWTANALGETAASAAEAMEQAALEAERRLLGADARLEGTSASRRPSSWAAISSRGWSPVPGPASGRGNRAGHLQPQHQSHPSRGRYRGSARPSRRQDRSLGASSPRSPTRSTSRHRSSSAARRPSCRRFLDRTRRRLANLPRRSGWSARCPTCARDLRVDSLAAMLRCARPAPGPPCCRSSPGRRSAVSCASRASSGVGNDLGRSTRTSAQCEVRAQIGSPRDRGAEGAGGDPRVRGVQLAPRNVS